MMFSFFYGGRLLERESRSSRLAFLREWQVQRRGARRAHRERSVGKLGKYLARYGAVRTFYSTQHYFDNFYRNFG